VITTIGLAALAGLLSILSPCVLPLIPVVLGGASAQHRFGPAALAAGLALSFTGIGLFVATIGFQLGFEGGFFRALGACVMVAIGLILALPALQARATLALAPVSNWVEGRFGQSAAVSASGPFGVGLLLGAVWSPCVGPTLGAASLLASRGTDLGAVALTMAAFGLGAALPLLALGLLTRATLSRWRDQLLTTGKFAKQGMGLAFILIGMLILTGLDKALETRLVEISPLWLTALTSRF
jgi:cytochrome c biogenesis protein CcdA